MKIRNSFGKTNNTINLLSKNKFIKIENNI